MRRAVNFPAQTAGAAGTTRRWPNPGQMIEASRTLMKSEPELAELIAEAEGVEVTMAEKGFGTRVQVRADEETGLEVADLEAFLDRLAEPQRRPFV